MTALGLTRRSQRVDKVDTVTALLVTRRLRPIELYAVDAAVAVVAGGMLCAYAALESPERGSMHEPGWVSVLVGLTIGLPVAARRRRPVGVAVFVSLAAAMSIVTGVVPDFAAAAAAVSLALPLYTVGVSVPLRRSLPVAVGCLAAVSGALAAVADQLWSAGGGILFGALMVVPAWLTGWTVRERRAASTHHRDHLIEQAAAQERLHMARELHDIVAHTMSLIVVKAAVGNHVAEARPQEARDALRVIETTGRGAMRQMRQVLGMLRDDDTPYAPAAGLDDLPGLAEQAAIGGVDVALEIRRDTATPVPAAVGLAVFRIVQEAVTNVVRHAAPATCRVTVAVAADVVEIDVTDDGRRPVRLTGTGHGLIGMRERVGLHGGDFSAGPRAGGGFRVTARIPYESVE